MVRESKLQSEEIRLIDPNVKQWAASNPLESVWVSASAGTGKTKVLTDRVLRLLLPRPDGQPGTAPHRILCLTYTKAAASEMMLRINERLGEWVVLEEEKLKESLKKTTGTEPGSDVVAAARQLFAKVVDTPGGLKIMTIHAFCQSVLGRFPLEAAITPQMKIMDAAVAQDMMRGALLEIAGDPNGKTYGAFQRLSIEMAESKLLSNLQDCFNNAPQIEKFFTENSNPKAALNEALNAPDQPVEELMADFCHSAPESSLKQLADAFAKGSKTDQGRAEVLYGWLSDTEKRIQNYQAFKAVFLTQKDKPRAKPSKSALEFWPMAEDVQGRLAMQILELEDQMKAIRLAELTYDLLALAQDVRVRYEAEKAKAGYLDYNDLILKTLALLQRAQRAVPWVLYKLDGGLDHILVDEAQDTNPAQWEIIRLLAEEFFSGQEEDVRRRTLFVVGDEKQSIYRFQGASLEDFKDKHVLLQNRAEIAGAFWRNEHLQMSFRSTRSVLNFVDRAFQNEPMRRDIGVPETDELNHLPFFHKRAGQVSLWPLCEAAEKEEEKPWELPIEVKDVKGAKALLAEQIADEISEWIVNKRELPSKKRAVQPGDIMVLVRSRDAFVEMLIRALKTRFIPVSGADRLVLTHHIAVQDLLSLAKFALQPQDDLSLAEILTSPFVGMGEKELEDLAYGHERGKLWQVLRQKGDTALISWLEACQKAATLSPFNFFFEMLNTPCPADEVSGLRAVRKRLGEDCLDILDEFLSAVQKYEHEYVGTLDSFIVWQGENPIEIKREFDGQENTVQIMTVHGAKGLQAPIVFLPDTLRTTSAVQNKIPRLIIPHRSSAPTPLWSPRKAADCQAYQDYFDEIAAQETAEYKRLFYVAATRAEDELIVCGAQPGSKPDMESWYYYAQEAFDNLGAEVEKEEAGRKIYRHYQEEEVRPQDIKEKITKDIVLPPWIYKQAPEEPIPTRPFRPSRPSESEPAFASPLQQDDQYRFRRGNLTHALLQFLPDLPQEQRAQAGETFLTAQAQDLEASIRDDILRETLNTMQNETFAAVFSAEAQAEVSLSGYLPSGRLISGQIDRLLIRDKDILIIDYKTNRPPPTEEKDVPEVYHNQMRAYKEALAKIYPEKEIKCALLWTYAPKLMVLERLNSA